MEREYKKETGFTLLEVLFSFTILLFLIFLIPGLIRLTGEIKSQVPYEAEVFLEQAGRDIRLSKLTTVGNRKLYLKRQDGTTITYDQYGKLIRRQVNGSGHEVLLQNVNSIHFGKVNNGVFISIFDSKNRTIKRRISNAPISWGDL